MAAFMLTEYYLCKIVGVKGPSMLPTIDSKDNLVFLDCFTTRFVRKPRKGDIILAENPFKPGYTIVKRVLNVEGEYAEFYDKLSQQ